MRKWITGLALVALAGCGGDDPQGPSLGQMVEAVVPIDWPLAREDGFVDTSYRISLIYKEGDLASGPFTSAGTAEARFPAECGRPIYLVRATGHFAQWEEHPDLPDDAVIDCTEVRAFSVPCNDPAFTVVPVHLDPPAWGCAPPLQ